MLPSPSICFRFIPPSIQLSNQQENLHEFSSRGIRDYTFDLQTSGNLPCASLFPAASFTGEADSDSNNKDSTSANSSRIRSRSIKKKSDEDATSSSSYLVQPDPGALTRRFGGYKLGDGLAGVRNLIWSNGLLDPWHGGGFLTAPPGSTTTGSTSSDDNNNNHWVIMPSGAHHLDLRGPDPADPADVTEAREYEEQVIRGWIEDYALKSAALLSKVLSKATTGA
jgi:hypothetical protein